MTYNLPHGYKIKRAKGGLFEMLCLYFNKLGS